MFPLLLIFLLSSIAFVSVNTQIIPSSVSLTVRTEWCQAQIITCGILCSSFTNVDNCNTTTLTYDCTCASNNSAPDLGSYTNTLPTFICEQVYANCIESALGDISGQSACTATEKADCGQLNPNDFVASAASTSTLTLTSTIVKSTSLSSKTTGSSAAQSTAVDGTTNTGSTTSSSSASSTSSIITTGAGGALQAQTITTAADSTSSPISSTNTSSPTKSGLSTGAKAGIGIGAAIIVISLALGGYCLGSRHSKPRRDPEARDSRISELSTHTHLEVPELGGEKGGWWNRRGRAKVDREPVNVYAAELDGGAVHEIEG